MLRVLTVCVLLRGLAAVDPSYPDFLLESARSSKQVAESPLFLARPLEEGGGDKACSIPVTIVTPMKGKCLKLGEGLGACVSGSYLHPFHEDCKPSASSS